MLGIQSYAPQNIEFSYHFTGRIISLYNPVLVLCTYVAYVRCVRMYAVDGCVYACMHAWIDGWIDGWIYMDYAL